MLKQYPSLVKNCVPKLTQSLQVVAPTEEAAFGACNILKSRSLLRHLMQVGWLVGCVFSNILLNCYPSLQFHLQLGFSTTKLFVSPLPFFSLWTLLMSSTLFRV
jgi:hypothetical protein